MSEFNLDATAGASQSSASAPLEVNKIHDVIFTGIEAKDTNGHEMMIVRFENKDGKFSKTFFAPKKTDKQNDFERRSGVSAAGKAWTFPSNFEVLMLTCKHIIDAVNPALGEKIDNKEKSLSAPNWNSFRKLMVQATEKHIDTPLQIKLMANYKGDPDFPQNAIAISKEDDKTFIGSNFIGKKLFFSSYETKNMTNVPKAKPTATSTFDISESGAKAETAEDLDFNLD